MYPLPSLHYGADTTIVFDGYEEGPSIKHNTHQRRGRNVHHVVSFTAQTELSGTLQREAAVLALSRKAQANEDHLLHRMLQERSTRARLKSRHPFCQQADHLSDLAPPGVTKQSWLRTRWKDDWLAAPPSRLHNFIRDPRSVPGLDLPRKQWTTLNRLRTGVGRFSSSMLKWGLMDSSVCECGAPEQTVDHILDVCPHNTGRRLAEKELSAWTRR